MDRAVAPVWLVPAKVVLWLGLGTVALAWLGFLAVDVFDVAGMQRAIPGDVPLVYHHVFNDGHPGEWMQWLLLSLGGIGAALAAGLAAAAGERRMSLCWLLLALGTSLMVIEDAGNPRHLLRSYVETGLGDRAGPIAVLLFLVIFAGIPFLVPAVFWRELRSVPGATKLLLVGLAAYGLRAASITFTMLGQALGREPWYSTGGRFLLDTVFGGRVTTVPMAVEWFEHHRDPEAAMFMDSIVEESVELVGATFLCAAAMVAARVMWLRVASRAHVDAGADTDAVGR